MSHINVGFLGAGRVSVAHIEALARRDDCSITHVFDPSGRSRSSFLARVPEAVPATSAGELLAAEVDAVVIAAPTQHHFDLASRALRAGKHVLMEKPFARSVAQACTLRDLAVDRGIILMPAQVARFLPAVRGIRERLLVGSPGPLVQAIERRVLHRTEVFEWWQSVPEFLIAHWGSHSLDVFLWLANDEPEEVRCWASSRQAGYSSIDDFTLVTHTVSGGVISLHQTFASREEHLDWLLIFENDTASVDGMHTSRLNDEVVVSGTTASGMEEAFASQAEEFILASRGERSLETTVDSVLPSLRALETAVADADVGQVTPAD